MSDTITVTDGDIARIAAKIEGADVLPEEDLTALAAIFYLAGQASAEVADDVQGFMPVYMKLGDIKGEINTVSLNFSRSALTGGLLPSFNQGAVGAKGLA